MEKKDRGKGFKKKKNQNAGEIIHTFAASFLEENRKKGRTIEIPSLNIKIKGDDTTVDTKGRDKK